jgi:hypothetical protein
MARAAWPQEIATILILGWAGVPSAQASQATPCIKFKVVDGARMLVPVHINGQGPYRFLLDTGAAITMVDDAVARKAGLRPMTNIDLTTLTGVARMPLAPVESIGLGDRVVREMKVVYCDLSKAYSFTAGIHGVLGQDFLSNFNYLVNRKERAIRFEESGELEETLLGQRIPTERRQSKFYLLVPGADGSSEPMRFLLDSGSPYLVVYDKPATAGRLSVISFERNTLLAESAIGKRKLRPCRVGGFRIGNHSLANLRVILAETLPGEQRFEDGLLPLRMFAAVYFNNAGNYVILDPVLPK